MPGPPRMRVDILLSPPAAMPLEADAGKRSLRLALDRFLRDVERRALRVAELSCGNREDALELVQEAMFGFVRGYAGKPPEEWPLLFWRVLDSRLTDFQRRRRVRSRWMSWFAPRDEDDDEDPLARVPDPAEPGPLARLGDDEAMRTLERALRGLPARQRQAFLLRVWEGLDVAGTAQAMGLSEGSVKTHLFRALQRLRASLEEGS
jgi:RNA polymerase sigma-70 factor (ECF subfamily)